MVLVSSFVLYFYFPGVFLFLVSYSGFWVVFFFLVSFYGEVFPANKTAVLSLPFSCLSPVFGPTSCLPQHSQNVTIAKDASRCLCGEGFENENSI